MVETKERKVSKTKQVKTILRLYICFLPSTKIFNILIIALSYLDLVKKNNLALNSMFSKIKLTVYLKR